MAIGAFKYCHDRYHVSDPRCAIPASGKIKRQGKNIQFDINVCEAREVETAVANGRSLVGIGVSRHHIRGLNYTALHNETNFLYCAVGHPLFECDDKQIMSSLKKPRSLQSNYMRDKESRNDGLNYQNSAVAYHDEGIAHLILSGEFIGYLPDHYAQFWLIKVFLKLFNRVNITTIFLWY